MLKAKINGAIIITLALGIFPLQAVAASPRIKDGKQYALNLGLRLELSVEDIMMEFNKIKANLPKEKNFSALAPGIAGLTKFAAAACSYANDLTEEDWNDVSSLYVQILDRDPTKEDLAAAIESKDGRFAFYANCLKISLMPEMIYIVDDNIEFDAGVINAKP